MISLKPIFGLCLSVLTIYSLLITIRIILSWIPFFYNSGILRFLSALCDPFLNMFKKIRWLKIGMLDLSPILALAILTICSSVFAELYILGTINTASIIKIIVKNIFSVIQSILSIIIILMAVRFLIHLIQPSSASGFFWENFDRIFNPLIYKFGRHFFYRKFTTYRTCMLTTIILFILIKVGLSFAGSWIINLINYIQYGPQGENALRMVL